MNDHWWQHLIKQHPADSLHYLGYADWLEEQGCLRAARAFRWMGRTGKHPGRREHYRGQSEQTRRRLVPEKVGWAWMLSGEACHDHHFLDDSCELPDPLFVALHGKLSRDHHYYSSWEEAIDALIHGLELLRHITEGRS